MIITEKEMAATAILSAISSVQNPAENGGVSLPCPRCGQAMQAELNHNSLSRRANILICPRCGTDEALEALENAVDEGYQMMPLHEWAAVIGYIGGGRG